jgi:hypothetical protein
MISLDKTTRTLQAVLVGAVTTNELHVTVCYYDVTAQTKEDNSEYRRAMKLTKTTGTTPVVICTAPSANGTARNVDYISVQNADTVSSTVTIQVDDGGTTYNQCSQALSAGETLIYEHEGGWQII